MRGLMMWHAFCHKIASFALYASCPLTIGPTHYDAGYGDPR
jgi:hypothetical protein